jgi:hypothetical protein
MRFASATTSLVLVPTPGERTSLIGYFGITDAKDGTWNNRDQYIVVQDSRGVAVMEGTSFGLEGRDMLDRRDPQGKSVAGSRARSRMLAG